MKKRLKKILWNLMGVRLQSFYVALKLEKNPDYKSLSNGKENSSRIILLDTPTHGNIGDQAIAVAEKKFLKDIFPVANILEFTYEECKFCKKKIASYISVDDCIIIHGGGFLGTLWPSEEENFLSIVRQFKNNRIIVFPQTIFFDGSWKGKQEKRKFLRIIGSCKNLVLFFRDQRSYDWMKRHDKNMNCAYYLVPDIVTTYKYNKASSYKRRKHVLFCMRDDGEKIFQNNDILEQLAEKLKKRGYQCSYTDTVMQREIKKEDREKIVNVKLKQFSQMALVITDRLHGMIFSAITATPCIAMDNVSHKVSGGYMWLDHLEYIECMKGRLSIEDVENMLEKKACKYDNECLEPYYRKMEQILLCRSEEDADQ